jgi:lipoate-protein ligase B
MEKTIVVTDLGTMPYRDAWKEQERIHESVLSGGPETILLVQHLPVVTLGRREDSIRNLVTPPDQLPSHNVDLVHSDRGGDITFHGPGQIVAYPIIRLNSHGFSVGGYVHRLEAIVIATLKEIGIEATTDPKAVGVWVHAPLSPSLSTLGEGRGEGLEKIAAIGVRIRRGISLHGLALNVEGDLSGFSHIIPCGLTGRGVTSVRKILGDNAPSIAEVKKILTRKLLHGLA